MARASVGGMPVTARISQSSSAGALSAPAGYVPVSGGSFGCGVR